MYVKSLLPADLPFVPPNPRTVTYHDHFEDSILSCLNSNSYNWAKQTRLDWFFNRRIWREVSEDMYVEQREVLPPICYEPGAFMVGECAEHATDGTPLYSVFWAVGDGKFYTMHMTVEEFKGRKFLGAPRQPVPSPLQIID